MGTDSLGGGRGHGAPAWRNWVLLAAMLASGGCLRRQAPWPEARPRADAGRPPDAWTNEAGADHRSPPATPEPTLRVMAHDGSDHPTQAAPRRPVLEVLGLASPAAACEAPDDAPAVALFAGPPDETLAEDLSRRPLRVAHRSRLVPLRCEDGRAPLRLRPLAPLRSGARYTLAVAAWATDAAGEPVG